MLRCAPVPAAVAAPRATVCPLGREREAACGLSGLFGLSAHGGCRAACGLSGLLGLSAHGGCRAACGLSGLLGLSVHGGLPCGLRTIGTIWTIGAWRVAVRLTDYRDYLDYRRMVGCRAAYGLSGLFGLSAHGGLPCGLADYRDYLDYRRMAVAVRLADYRDYLDYRRMAGCRAAYGLSGLLLLSDYHIGCRLGPAFRKFA